MNIIDTYPEIVALIVRSGGQFDKAEWKEYIGSISHSLTEKLEQDSGDYDFDKEIAPVLNMAFAKTGQLKQTHEAFVEVTAGLAEKTAALFGFALPVDIILYVGLCNGAGWATALDSKRTILLGMEKIVELDWCSREDMQGLIYHELGHIWHDIAGGEPAVDFENPREKSVWQLFREGVAMHVEQLLCGDEMAYHQNKHGWLDWCTRNRTQLWAEYQRRTEQGESTQPFFGDWCSYQGHSDVGYYLGCEFVKALAKKYSLQEIAAMGIDCVTEQFLLCRL